jgi:hypothetical protein
MMTFRIDCHLESLPTCVKSSTIISPPKSASRSRAKVHKYRGNILRYMEHGYYKVQNSHFQISENFEQIYTSTCIIYLVMWSTQTNKCGEPNQVFFCLFGVPICFLCSPNYKLLIDKISPICRLYVSTNHFSIFWIFWISFSNKSNFQAPWSLGAKTTRWYLDNAKDLNKH